MAPPRNPKPSKAAAARAAAKAEKAAQREHDELAARVAELLAALLDRKQPVAARMEALQGLAALDFLGPRFDAFRADYKQALRTVATDPSAQRAQRENRALLRPRDGEEQSVVARRLWRGVWQIGVGHAIRARARRLGIGDRGRKRARVRAFEALAGHRELQERKERAGERGGVGS